MNTAQQNITFLCGVIDPRDSLYRESNIKKGIIYLRRYGKITVQPSDPGLRYVISGRCRMIVVREGAIWTIYGRPRIKLLRMLERGIYITEEILEMYSPMYASWWE